MFLYEVIIKYTKSALQRHIGFA